MSETEGIFSEKQREALSRNSPTPLYFQLYNLLRACIVEGKIETGMRLPTEKELAEDFGVSRITAKRSLDELAKQNLVERHRGKGTHVIYRYKPRPMRAPLIGMLQEIESMARNSRAVILDCAMLQPPRHVREEFSISPGETVLYLERVRERDGIPFAYYRSWTVGVKKPRNAKIFEKTPRLSYFRQNGLEISHVKQTISAAAATPEAAQALDLEPGAPLLSLTRRSYKQEEAGEELVDYLLVLYHPDHFQYRMDLTLES